MSNSFQTNSLQLENLTIIRDKAALLSLNETIKGGEVLTIMGPSGSGKSTLLNWLTGMLPKGFQAEGNVHLNGRDITQVASYQRHIGLLYQDALLFPHLSVANNIAFAMPKGDQKARALKISFALAEVGLAGLDNRQPDSLSGGQQARVALLRVLLSEPKAILLDEPFSKLDSQLRQETRELVFEQIRQHKLPAIMVTHDESDAIAANGKVIHLSAT
ncbi:ATP-binding cassette domain-containing protein [Colwellia sp. Arc7-635]|uniref:ATP-binding cassette domain-containing protein n=1 Tax=Colwellia sp. Arc7-635 TaxID=2497879 RepID=UPI000F85679E|nr:ATP-binding cassette domain-containing protein [Colwellia sp. Arc7-635]AZQ83695.1 ATP-binding cassette domain-containing protein [Colwellia sp. Arc7-635]